MGAKKVGIALLAAASLVLASCARETGATVGSTEGSGAAGEQVQESESEEEQLFQQIPLPDALEMFSCLKRAGCPARLCLFHGENHELSRSGRPDNRITRLQEIVTWFETYLMK